MNLEKPSRDCKKTTTHVELPGGLSCTVYGSRTRTLQAGYWFEIHVRLPARQLDSCSWPSVVLLPQLQFRTRAKLLGLELTPRWGNDTRDACWRWRRTGSDSWAIPSRRLIQELTALRAQMAVREAARQSEGSHYFRVARLLGEL